MKAWAESFYKSNRWQHCRESFMTTKYYLCDRSGEPATVAHHKKRLTAANITQSAISLAWDNLEALCQECHNKEHHRKAARPARYRLDAAGRILPP